MSTKTVVFLQDACFRHHYIRSRETSAHVERPERLHAVKLGLAAAIARLEELLSPKFLKRTSGSDHDRATADDLADALDRMNLVTDIPKLPVLLVPIINSSASVDVSNHPAVKFAHDDVYLENLILWARESQVKIAAGLSEIPKKLSQTDLYLCPGSIDAIQGAIGTVCEAVDTVIRSTMIPSSHSDPPNVNWEATRAFVAVRPPGHHCGDETPSGFCFVNNVMIGAAHAHLQHGVNRVVILDIDLHHGNGTQSIAWQINEQTYMNDLEGGYHSESSAKLGLKIYYGSIHDILSYPCEDGKIDMVQAASVSLHGSHGQHVENIHLERYTSDEHFWEVLYKTRYSRLLGKAKDFIENTGPEDDVMVFISCGFDACEHEYPFMSRHSRKVPASFYYRFTRDACAFADHYAKGRIVSVLEGGYSNRALISGAMAHLSGLTDVSNWPGMVDENWWGMENLVKLEHATKKHRGVKEPENTATPDAWIERTVAIFSVLNASSAHHAPTSSRNTINVPPTSMTLRERSRPASSTEPSPAASPSRVKATASTRGGKQKRVSNSGQHSRRKKSSSSPDEDPPEGSLPHTGVEPKKLPRVILRLPDPPSVE